MISEESCDTETGVMAAKTSCSLKYITIENRKLDIVIIFHNITDFWCIFNGEKSFLLSKARYVIVLRLLKPYAVCFICDYSQPPC